MCVCVCVCICACLRGCILALVAIMLLLDLEMAVLSSGSCLSTGTYTIPSFSAVVSLSTQSVVCMHVYTCTVCGYTLVFQPQMFMEMLILSAIATGI